MDTHPREQARERTACVHDVLGRIADRLDGPLVVVDVGAQSLHGEDHVYAPLRRLGLPVRVIGFEPLADRAAARRAEEGGHSCEIVEAFIGDGSARVFHENNANTTSSLLPLDREMCGGFVSLAGLRTVATSQVRTTTLDDLFAGDAVVDFLKLDIQGFELAALRGAVAMLPRVAMIQSEVEFTPIYSGQPLFSELELFLRGKGFDFLDFYAPARRAPVVPSGAVRNEQLLWADALFTARLADAPDRALLAQAILAIALYGRLSVAERALAAYDRRHGTAIAATVAALDAEEPAAGQSRTQASGRHEDADASWVAGQTNAALRDDAAVARAEAMLRGAGLALHPDRPKNWDGALAIFHALDAAAAGPGTRLTVLDAGAERYSAFLPALESLGFSDLTGINLVFGAPERAGAILFRQGDITHTGLPDASHDFIACLSVIEHGVDIAAFLRESARLLRPGGKLFVSFDYWQDPVDTRGQYAYGVPVRILTAADVAIMLSHAEEAGLVLDGPSDFACHDRVAHWQRLDLRYTFANLLLRRV